MKLSPVSFKSLMVFTINDGKPRAAVPDMVRTAFAYNPTLKPYALDQDNFIHEEKIDGTVYNASTDFAEMLDKKYKEHLPKGSSRVILTEADFYVNPTDTEKRYFLTAATQEDEDKIHKVLSKSKIFYAAKFRDKAN